MQEVLQHQLLDLLGALNSSPNPSVVHEHKTLSTSESDTQEWAYIGVGRDDGAEAGEYVPILYRPGVFELREHTVEWLSPKPKERGWDAGCIRIVTIAIFAHRGTGKECLVMNTHLDNSGLIARRESAKLMEELAQRWRRRVSSTGRKSEDRPLILCGDLNSDEHGEAYQILRDHVGLDARDICPKGARYGEEMTFTGFQGKKNEEERIDYIFVDPLGPTLDQPLDEQQAGDAWTVRSYAVLPNRFESSAVYLSDHRAVVADLEL